MRRERVPLSSKTMIRDKMCTRYITEHPRINDFALSACSMFIVAISLKLSRYNKLLISHAMQTKCSVLSLQQTLSFLTTTNAQLSHYNNLLNFLTTTNLSAHTSTTGLLALSASAHSHLLSTTRTLTSIKLLFQTSCL